jgi:prephenate dehydratase
MTEKVVENIYYLGPDGSNTYYAMQQFIEKSNIKILNKLPQKSIKSALENFSKDYSSICILPVENSIEGIVRETIDNFLKFTDNSIQIHGEITIPINHMLLSKGNHNITKIYSHPQALAQCSAYLYKNYPNAELKDVSSTSYAAQRIAEGESEAAAIANETCAELFDLDIIAKNINDEQGNKTRFFIFGRNEITKPQEGKTALMVSTKNEHGALCSVLQIFAKHNINMSCIESRPSKKKLGEYIFFIELDGLKDEYGMSLALEEIMAYADFVKILGSFQEYK